MQSIDYAIAEMRFAQELGMRVVFCGRTRTMIAWRVTPTTTPSGLRRRNSISASASTKAGQAVCRQWASIVSRAVRATHYLAYHGNDAVALSVIWGGVCERFPQIRIGFLESGGGWIAPWLDRMDRHFDDQGFNDSGLRTRPSALFQRNCWISFEPVEGSLNVLADYIGPNKILWATDYPHPDGFSLEPRP